MPNFARLLSIGYSPVFGEDHMKMTSFASDTSMFDFDIVIWDPERSLELFGIMCEVREKPSRAERWQKALLNTVGRISGVPEWYVYLDDAAVEDAEKPKMSPPGTPPMSKRSLDSCWSEACR